MVSFTLSVFLVLKSQYMVPRPLLDNRLAFTAGERVLIIIICPYSISTGRVVMCDGHLLGCACRLIHTT